MKIFALAQIDYLIFWLCENGTVKIRVRRIVLQRNKLCANAKNAKIFLQKLCGKTFQKFADALNRLSRLYVIFKIKIVSKIRTLDVIP